MKLKSDINSLDIYKHYRTYIDKPVVREDFRKIINEFSHFLINKLYEGYTFRIPAGVGSFYITKRKIKHVFKEDGSYDLKRSTSRINWFETKKFWKDYPELKGKKYIVFENDHTNGNIMRLTWDRKGHQIKNLACYRFKPARHFSRGLAKFLKINPNVDYYTSNR